MKKIIALFLTMVLVLSLVGCSNKSVTFNIEKTSSIGVTLGSTNEKAIIADEGFVQDITNNINSLEFEKAEKAVGQIGWSYTLDWLDENDNKTTSIIIVSQNGSQILRDGYYYNVKGDKNIDTDLISEMLDIALSSSPAPEMENGLIDFAFFDIDNDGVLEDCSMTYGPTSGLFTVVFTASCEGNIKYKNTFNMNSGSRLTFEEKDGVTYFVRDGEFHKICVDKNRIVIDNLDSEYEGYWGDSDWNYDQK